jgi:glutaredoxin-related protein
MEVRQALDKEFIKTFFDNFGRLIAVLYFDSTRPETVAYRDAVLTLAQLQEDKDVLLVACDVHECTRWPSEFKVQALPTVLLTRTDRAVLQSLEQLPPAMLMDRLEQQLQAFRQEFALEKERMVPEVRQVVENNRLAIFIKGTPEAPECGFTRQFLELLAKLRLPFFSVNILAQEKMRYWTRHVGGWPTYPQFWVAGKVIGGLDTLRELIASRAILTLLP